MKQLNLFLGKKEKCTVKLVGTLFTVHFSLFFSQKIKLLHTDTFLTRSKSDGKTFEKSEILTQNFIPLLKYRSRLIEM